MRCILGILVLTGFAIIMPQAWAQAPSPEPACVGDACKTNLSTRIPDKNTVLPPFKNCEAARKAGVSPVLRGHPGYGPHLDTDGDGMGCEDGRLQITPSRLAIACLAQRRRQILCITKIAGLHSTPAQRLSFAEIRVTRLISTATMTVLGANSSLNINSA